MERSRKRKTKPQQTLPPATVMAGRRFRLSARGGESVAGEGAVVRRSDIMQLLACGLCGGILREATTVSECLHTFCRKCIYEKFKDEGNKYCPTCRTDLGSQPKLRHRTEEISSLPPELVSPETAGLREELENERAQTAAACDPICPLSIEGRRPSEVEEVPRDELEVEEEAAQGGSGIGCVDRRNPGATVFARVDDDAEGEAVVVDAVASAISTLMSEVTPGIKSLSARMRGESQFLRARLAEETRLREELAGQLDAARQEAARLTAAGQDLRNKELVAREDACEAEEKLLALIESAKADAAELERLEGELGRERELKTQAVAAAAELKTEVQKLQAELKNYNDALPRIQAALRGDYKGCQS